MNTNRCLLAPALLALIVVAPHVGGAQDNTPTKDAAAADDRWAPFRYFLGAWEGDAIGFGRQSSLERSCELVLKDQFLRLSTVAIFPPQEGLAEGERHEDWGMLSYDTARKTFVFRQYFGEGFMNQYLAEIAEDGRTITMTTELIESFEPGWRARLTFRIIDEDTFEQRLELAQPDKDYFTCQEGTLRRKK